MAARVGVRRAAAGPAGVCPAIRSLRISRGIVISRCCAAVAARHSTTIRSTLSTVDTTPLSTCRSSCFTPPSGNNSVTESCHLSLDVLSLDVLSLQSLHVEAPGQHMPPALRTHITAPLAPFWASPCHTHYASTASAYLGAIRPCSRSSIHSGRLSTPDP